MSQNSIREVFLHHPIFTTQQRQLNRNHQRPCIQMPHYYCQQQFPLLISRHSLNWKKHDSNIIQYIVHTEPISNPVPPVHSAAPTIHYTNLSKQSCANANIQLYIMSYVKLSTLLAPKSQYILLCTASEFWNIYEKYLTCYTFVYCKWILKHLWKIFDFYTFVLQS